MKDEGMATWWKERDLKNIRPKKKKLKLKKKITILSLFAYSVCDEKMKNENREGIPAI